MSDTCNSGMDRETRDEIIEIINEVEAKVLAEDKLGASRDQIAEGTCERIRERIYSVGTGSEHSENNHKSDGDA